MDTYPKHPGKITFVDGNTQQVTDEVNAEDVPNDIAFVEVEGVFRPVIRIVAFTTDEQRTIRQYGPEGELLKSTIQLRSP